MADDIIDDFSTSNATTSNGPPAGPNAGPRTTASLDRAVPLKTPGTGVTQPKPQALPKRTGAASIIVSPRQKGNPILSHIKGLPWEYGDIPADYVLGLTTCALFLSLKYHRLHPEYIYSRIKDLKGKYNLRVVLCMVDIQNHEASLKELSKTSLVNNVTIVLCWSAAEGGRYLELFKTYEHAGPSSIKTHQSDKYSDRMVDFITTPRSINKTDAVALVSQFGTVRTAVNARHEDVATIAGWGEKKVKRWCGSVREPFRIQRAARRGVGVGPASQISREVTRDEGETLRVPGATMVRDGLASSLASRPATAVAGDGDADLRPRARLGEEMPLGGSAAFRDDEEAMAEALTGQAIPAGRTVASTEEQPAAKKRKKDEEDPLSDGVMAALSKLRKT